MKVKCSKCLVEKEQNTEFFSLDKRNKLGLAAECKVCRSSYKSKYNLVNKEKIAITSLKYREANREKINGRSRAYKRVNRDKIRIADREYRLANKEKEVARRKKYKQDNKDLIRAKDKVYREANKPAANTRNAKRRATKLQATPVWANYGYIKLFYEGAKIEEARTGRKVHVDHIVPLQGKLVCGLHCEDNLQLLFAEDNLSKNNKFEVEV